MKKYILFFVLSILLFSNCAQKNLPAVPDTYSGNPILPGWYADPEGIIFNDEYWIYPTYSDDYQQPDRSTEFSKEQLAVQKNTINKQYLIQTFVNAFSSKDLITWTKHPHVLDIKNVKWAAYSIWAPAIMQVNSKYYLFFRPMTSKAMPNRAVLA